MSSPQTTSRRSFLQATVATGTALTVGLDVARLAHAAGSDVLKLGLVGCGGRGSGAAAQAIQARPDVELVALGDLFPDKLDRAKKALQPRLGNRMNVADDMLFSGFDAFKKLIASGVDVVMLATPPGFRPYHYAAAIAAGKHVFMEKPLAVDAPGYRLLMETNKIADQKGLKVAVGLQRRHCKRYTELVPKIQDGMLGKLSLLRCYWNGAHAANGYQGEPPKEGELEWQLRNWNHFCWLSGDHIVEQHIHNIDVCNWIMRDQHPVTANGMGGRQVRRKSNMYDHHFVEYTYADGTKLYSQARQMAGCWNPVTEFAHGSDGEIELGTNGNDGYVTEHADLAAAIKNDTKLNDAWHGANSTMTAILGRMATHSGVVVKWDDAVKSEEHLAPEISDLGTRPPITVGADGFYPVDIPGIYKPYPGA